MTDLSDHTIIARVRAGDIDAFGVLVDRYQDRMIAYVRHMGFGEGDAVDIVQEGFVRAYRHLGRCGDPDRFEGWLFRITSNLCRTAGRKRVRTPLEPIEDHGGTLASPDPAPDARVEASLQRARVRAALNALPDDQREALVLMYLHGHGVTEIAERVGASLSAVKMRLMRGREALRAELGSWISEGE